MKHLRQFVLFGLMLLPQLALASTCAAGSSGLCNPLGYSDLTTFLQKLLQLVAQIGFPVIVLFMVYVGFQYVTASGNPEKLKKLHSYLLWTVVGALIVLGAEALSLAIQATVNQLSTGVQ